MAITYDYYRIFYYVARYGGVSHAAKVLAADQPNLTRAVKNLESVTLDSVRTYGERFTGDYMSDPADAIVTDYSAGIDFAFTWYGAGSLLISVYDDGDWLYCDVYEYSE